MKTLKVEAVYLMYYRNFRRRHRLVAIAIYPPPRARFGPSTILIAGETRERSDYRVSDCRRGHQMADDAIGCNWCSANQAADLLELHDHPSMTEFSADPVDRDSFKTHRSSSLILATISASSVLTAPVRLIVERGGRIDSTVRPDGEPWT